MYYITGKWECQPGIRDAEFGIVVARDVEDAVPYKFQLLTPNSSLLTVKTPLAVAHFSCQTANTAPVSFSIRMTAVPPKEKIGLRVPLTIQTAFCSS